MDMLAYFLGKQSGGGGGGGGGFGTATQTAVMVVDNGWTTGSPVPFQLGAVCAPGADNDIVADGFITSADSDNFFSVAAGAEVWLWFTEAGYATSDYSVGLFTTGFGTYEQEVTEIQGTISAEVEGGEIWGISYIVPEIDVDNERLIVGIVAN